MRQIKCLVIEDEKNIQDLIIGLIKEYCPEITTIYSASTVREAICAVDNYSPEIIFSDIELSDGNGFDLLEKIGEQTFQLIFITAHDNYALKALKAQCLDYLLKPIDIEELKLACGRAIKKLNESKGDLKIPGKEFNKSETKLNTVGLPTSEGLRFIKKEDILYCKADGSYTIVNLVKNEKLLVSKTLKEIEQLLAAHNFRRAHRSYLININAVERYDNGQGGCLIMVNAHVVPVSRRMKASFLQGIR